MEREPGRDPAARRSERFYTVPGAARLCCCSPDTIARLRRSGAFPRARKDGPHSNSPYLIPLGDLIDAGLYDPARPGSEAQDDDPLVLLDDLRRARAEVEVLRSRLEHLEALAAERAQFIKVLQVTLQNLTAKGGER